LDHTLSKAWAVCTCSSLRFDQRSHAFLEVPEVTVMDAMGLERQHRLAGSMASWTTSARKRSWRTSRNG